MRSAPRLTRGFSLSETQTDLPEEEGLPHLEGFDPHTVTVNEWLRSIKLGTLSADHGRVLDWLFLYIPEGMREVPFLQIPDEIISKIPESRRHAYRRAVHAWRLEHDEAYLKEWKRRSREKREKKRASQFERISKNIERVLSEVDLDPMTEMELRALQIVLGDESVKPLDQFKAVQGWIENERKRVEKREEARRKHELALIEAREQSEKEEEREQEEGVQSLSLIDLIQGVEKGS